MKQKEKEIKKEKIKKNKKDILNKAWIINLLAFIIPIFIICGFVLYKEILTKGNFFLNGNLINVADMGGQYTSLFTYFHNVLLGRDSIFYSFSNSIGNNMASTVGYYLSSPFNILYGLVSIKNISLMTFIIYTIKIGLCGLFMNMFLNYKFGSKKTNLMFSLTYAFMGYIVIYYFNLMWLDVLYMTPLVIIGINKLIDGKPIMYIITLALSVIFNFYIGYMLCIFCVIYFLYELFLIYKFKEFNKYKKIVLRFIISSIAAAGLAAFFLVPVAYNMSQVMRTPLPKDQIRFYIENVFHDFFDTVFSKIYIGSHGGNTILGRNRPVIYISLFSLILSILYFFNKNIKRRERVASLIVVLFFLISFLVSHLQLFWQGFTFPNGYIDRFSFLYSFFLIYLAAKQFYSEGKKKNSIWVYIVILIIYIAASIYIKRMELVYIYNKILIISTIFILIYLVIAYLMFNRINKEKRKKLNMFVFIIALVELIYNYNLTFITSPGYDISDAYSNKFDMVANKYPEAYRLEGLYITLVDNLAINNKGVNMALTTNNRNTYKFLYNCGQGLSYTTIAYDFNRLPIFDSLMSVRFLISGDNKGLYFEPVINKEGKTVSGVYINPYALNIGYMIDDSYYNKYDSKSKNSFDYLNNLVKALSGIDEDILIEIPSEKVGNKKYKFTIDRDDKNLFLTATYNLEINYAHSGSLYINDEFNGSIDTSNFGDYKIENKYYGEEIVIKIEKADQLEDIYLYYFNEKAFKKAIDKLKEHQLKETYMEGNTVKGKINIDKEGTLLVSVPYDKGWNVYVDGKKVNQKKIAGGLTGIDLKEGTHIIYMKFYCPGIKLGFVISIITICGISIYVIKNKNVKKS